MPNYNPETGIAYGYISANELDSERVHYLMYSNAESVNHTLNAYVEANPDDEECDDYYLIEEEVVEGHYKGVHYMSSWLGGALNFFIMESTHTCVARMCSPCVPGAGNLSDVVHQGEPDSEYPDNGLVHCYDVPEDWRYVKHGDW